MHSTNLDTRDANPPTRSLPSSIHYINLHTLGVISETYLRYNTPPPLTSYITRIGVNHLYEHRGYCTKKHFHGAYQTSQFFGIKKSFLGHSIGASVWGQTLATWGHFLSSTGFGHLLSMEIGPGIISAGHGIAFGAGRFRMRGLETALG